MASWRKIKGKAPAARALKRPSSYKRHYWPRSRITSTAACGVCAPRSITRNPAQVTCASCLKHMALANVIVRAMERSA